MEWRSKGIEPRNRLPSNLCEWSPPFQRFNGSEPFCSFLPLFSISTYKVQCGWDIDRMEEGRKLRMLELIDTHQPQRFTCRWNIFSSVTCNRTHAWKWRELSEWERTKKKPVILYHLSFRFSIHFELSIVSVPHTNESWSFSLIVFKIWNLTPLPLSQLQSLSLMRWHT